MRLNTVIRLPDGREGTICYNNLDGVGGVWGRHKFEMPPTGFGENLPYPDFMLREREMEAVYAMHGDRRECVGGDYDIVLDGDGEEPSHAG